MDDYFIFQDGDKWFIGRNHDHCDNDGNWGMSTELLGNSEGYYTQKEAEDFAYQECF